MAATEQARRDWAGVMQESVLGLQEWRAVHPRATFAAIEVEVDRRWSGLRATLLAELSLASPAPVDPGAVPLPCPQCGGMSRRGAGPRERTVVTLGQAAVTLRREYVMCTQCGYRFSPSGC